MILIYGKGKVGSALADLCTYQDIPYEIRDDQDTIDSFDIYDTIIPSPGIPSFHRIYQTGKIMAELDFAYQFLPKDFQIVSITGTDGKSTTSWIMYNILEKEYSVKKPVYLSGNFDVPFSATVLDILKKGHKKGSIVVEVSSFMAYAIQKFESDYSIFTNIKADHLNWHKDLTDYVASKMRIFERTRKMSFMNEQVVDFVRQNNLDIQIPENTRIFRGEIPEKESGIRDWSVGEDIIISGRKKYKLSETQFSGTHNAMNILSATLVAHALKICSKRVREYLRDISGLSHRLEYITTKQGIRCIEDSKSTSSQSLEAALSSFGTTKNLLLIVGGSDKGDRFDYLASRFGARVKALAAIGATKNQFIDIAKNEGIPHIATDALGEATEYLFRSGSAGDILILSPGCASFGLFKDYFDRANQFRDAIKKLPD